MQKKEFAVKDPELLREVMLLINKRLRERNCISEEMYRKTNEILMASKIPPKGGIFLIKESINAEFLYLIAKT